MLAPTSHIGHHVILDFFDCVCDKPILDELEEGIKIMEQMATFITPLGMEGHQFSPRSYSIVQLLQESHFSMHTWTEHDFVSLDLYHCGGDVPEKAIIVATHAFKPSKIVRTEVHRGSCIPDCSIKIIENLEYDKI